MMHAEGTRPSRDPDGTRSAEHAHPTECPHSRLRHERARRATLAPCACHRLRRRCMRWCTVRAPQRELSDYIRSKINSGTQWYIVCATISLSYAQGLQNKR